MFSIAVWQRSCRKLYLIRDRLGEKPLYYGIHDNSLLFGSELKALAQFDDFNHEIDSSALTLFFKFNYIPAPYSIYKNTFKLLPGHILTFDYSSFTYSVDEYWSIEKKAENKSVSSCLSESNVVETLESLLTKSISRQMLSDVPVGAFLSGGIDSTTIVSLMQGMSSRPINTFTIGFENRDFNEAEHARAISKYLGTDHNEITLSANDALEVIPKLSQIYDEPFSDSSQIPTFLLSQLAKEKVTVSLSGDGGDELFCGYNRYLFTQKYWSKLNKMPLKFRGALSNSLMSVSPEKWDKFGNISFLKKKFSNFGHKTHKAARVLHSESLEQLYFNIVSNWEDPTLLVRDSKVPNLSFISSEKNLDNLSTIDKMMIWDMQSYLTDDILVKMDRASMAASLESRVPLLDHNIVEFSLNLPAEYKFRHNTPKWPLRQILFKYVPQELIERPKQGFSLPISDWLRNDLRDWAFELIKRDKIESQGLLNADVVLQKWHEHQIGARDWSVQLWSVLIFQSWYENRTVQV
jgi:asparagine synthase (glutamine-hydrolysing)